MNSEPNFSDVPYQAHNILISELNDSSKELQELLNIIIKNSNYLNDKAQKPIDSIEELIEFIDGKTIYELKEILN